MADESLDLSLALSQLVSEWVKNSSGWFMSTDIDRDLKIDSRKAKTNRRVILHRLCAEGLIRRHDKKNGMFRLVTAEAPLVDWQAADTENTVDLEWPFGLEKLVKIYPKNIIVVAGSQNAGKTAFCLDFIQRNMHKHKMVYYTSEMGPEELKVRLSHFENSSWHFEARERGSNFADVVKPDWINVFDYLEITDNFFTIADELAGIFNALRKGVAVVALQKKRGADMGRGAEFSLEKPRLYLAMDSGLLKVVKAKNWAVKGENPNGIQWGFQLVDGCKFRNILRKE